MLNEEEKLKAIEVFYKKYHELYSELNFIVMDINNRYKSLFNERSCRI